jgi:indolepyruvate ferredoxin oxidoreductase alpha subunit
MVEASDSQECKDFVKYAYEISEKFDTPVIFRSTTRLSHSKGLVELGERFEVGVKDYKKDVKKYVMIPANAKAKHVEVEERLKKLKDYSNHCPLNRIELHSKKIGIITSGIAYQYAREVFGENASYLKIGMSYPLPDKMIIKFAKMVDKLYIVEENDPYLETYVKSLGIECIGKEYIPICGELNTDIVRKALIGEGNKNLYKLNVKVPSRPPVLCPGCPHRGMFYAVSKYKDIISTGDIGCYTLGLMPPLNVTDTVICMGAGISAGLGILKADKMAKRNHKVFGFLGDSTFFHSGITGLIDAVYNKTPMVIVILDNRITAMTGHQENPGTGKTLMGEATPIIDVEKIVKAVGVKEENIRVVDPYNLEQTENAVKDAYQATETFVIITKQPCALIKSVQKRRANMYCEVDQDKCKKCKSCMKTGCPAISFKDGHVVIDRNMCNGCTLCKQVCKFDAIKKVGE